MKNFKLILFISLFTFGLTACKKDTNLSPAVATKRITDVHWKLVKYLEAGEDKTGEFEVELDFYEDGTYKRSWIIFIPIPENGTWEFKNGTKNIQLTRSNGETELYHVIKLSKTELVAETIVDNKINKWFFEAQ